MFNVSPAARVPTLAGLDVPALPLTPLPHVEAGESPGERVALAGGVAMGKLYEGYARARRQRGAEPVMVIACADAVVGRDLIARRRGQALADELVGPLVWAWSEQEALAMLGEPGWRQLASAFDQIGHLDGMRVLLAVNGSTLEARVFRMAPAPKDAAPPGAGTEAEPAPSATTPAPAASDVASA